MFRAMQVFENLKSALAAVGATVQSGECDDVCITHFGGPHRRVRIRMVCPLRILKTQNPAAVGCAPIE